LHSFITPFGIVRESHLWKPLVVESQPTWALEMDFEQALLEWLPNTRLGRYRFVGLSAPDVYDAAGKPSSLTMELGEGSTVRIAGHGYLDGQRAVLVMNAISVVEMIEPRSIFSISQR
jgi:hypothetical protein